MPGSSGSSPLSRCCARKNTVGRALSCFWGCCAVCWSATCVSSISLPAPARAGKHAIVTSLRTSGHTLSSTISATILTKTDRRFGYAAIPMAALLAFSRLYLFVHFPSDVLAGAVLGLVIGVVVSRYGPKLFRKREK